MTDLTDDEFTVLMIAAQGQSMAAIARWEKPTDSLVEKGLLARFDKFNNSITRAGRVALDARDKADDESYRQILGLGTKVANARTQAQQSAEQAAQHLLMAARASVSVAGNSLDAAVRRWNEEVLRRALELALG